MTTTRHIATDVPTNSDLGRMRVWVASLGSIDSEVEGEDGFTVRCRPWGEQTARNIRVWARITRHIDGFRVIALEDRHGNVVTAVRIAEREVVTVRAIADQVRMSSTATTHTHR